MLMSPSKENVYIINIIWHMKAEAVLSNQIKSRRVRLKHLEQPLWCNADSSRFLLSKISGHLSVSN